MARVSTQLTQYQTNNSGRLPGEGTCTPQGTTVGAIGNTTDPNKTYSEQEKVLMANNAKVCDFIRNYMNSSTASNDAESEFIDPTGDPYNLTITTSIPSTLSYDAKTVYIIKKARCSGEGAISTKSSRDYAIMYKLEGSGTYCADNGS